MINVNGGRDQCSSFHVAKQMFGDRQEQIFSSATGWLLNHPCSRVFLCKIRSKLFGCLFGHFCRIINLKVICAINSAWAPKNTVSSHWGIIKGIVFQSNDWYICVSSALLPPSVRDSMTVIWLDEFFKTIKSGIWTEQHHLFKMLFSLSLGTTKCKLSWVMVYELSTFQVLFNV